MMCIMHDIEMNFMVGICSYFAVLPNLVLRLNPGLLFLNKEIKERVNCLILFLYDAV